MTTFIQTIQPTSIMYQPYLLSSSPPPPPPPPNPPSTSTGFEEDKPLIPIPFDLVEPGIYSSVVDSETVPMLKRAISTYSIDQGSERSCLSWSSTRMVMNIIKKYVAFGSDFCNLYTKEAFERLIEDPNDPLFAHCTGKAKDELILFEGYF